MRLVDKPRKTPPAHCHIVVPAMSSHLGRFGRALSRSGAVRPDRHYAVRRDLSLTAKCHHRHPLPSADSVAASDKIPELRQDPADSKGWATAPNC